MAARGATALCVEPSPGRRNFTVLPDRFGAFLGSVFRSPAGRAPRASASSISSAEAAEIVSEEGRSLITKYWGRYVALLQDQPRNRAYVIRDPSGVLPCLTANYKGAQLVFSHAGDFARLGLCSFSINWDVVRGSLQGRARPRTGKTAISELSEIQPGECLAWEGGRVTRSTYWNPARIAQIEPIFTFDQAVSELRGTVLHCVHAWAEAYPNIVHNLSGGLDSSIVLAALVSAPSRPRIVAVNFYTKTTEGDERVYARKSASRFGVNLIEQPLDGTSTDLSLLVGIEPSPFPSSGCATELMTGELEEKVADEFGADAFFCGTGGDGVFLQNGAETCTADYIRTRGFRWPMLSVARDAAEISMQSVWTVLRRGIADAVYRRQLRIDSDCAAICPFLHADLTDDATTEREVTRELPMRDDDIMPAGKIWHIYLSNFSASCRSFASINRPEALLPLMSQPIRETCLRIPTYLMFNGGIDRAVARQAFAQEVPLEILRRRSKGQINDMLREVLYSNLSFVREFLLDGSLMRHRILDRSKLERYLLGDRPRGVEGVIGCNEIVSTLLGTEAFLNSWESLSQNAA